MRTSSRRTGLSGFTVVRSGQLVSTTGTLLTSLSLAFWAFDKSVLDHEAIPAEAMS